MTREPCGRPVIVPQAFSHMNETHVDWDVADGRILRPYQQELK